MAQPVGKGQVGGQIHQQRALDNSSKARAIGQLGKAIEQTGHLAEQMHDEQKRQWTGQAELKFTESEGALQAKLARTADPGKHAEIAQRHFEEAKANILSNDSYTKKFRNDLSARLDHAGASRINQITTNAALKQVSNGRQIHNQRIKNRLADHDYAGASQLIMEGEGVYLTKEMMEVQLEEVGMRQVDHAKKQVKNDAINEIATDPMGWAERNEKPWEGDMAGDWLSLQNHAKAVRRSKGYDETDNVLDLIYSDEMTIEQLEQMTPHLRPKAREGLRVEYEKRQEYLAEGIRSSSVDQDSLTGKVGELLSTYEAEDVEDYDDKYAHIASLIRDIKDPSAKAEFQRVLKAKRDGQWADSKEKNDLLMKAFDDAIENDSNLEPAPDPEEEMSLSAHLYDDFLSDPENLRRAGFSEEHTEEIVEASEAWYGEGNRKGADPRELVRRHWSAGVKQDADYPAGKRAVLDAIRHEKTLSSTVVDPVAAAQADLENREREVANTKRKGAMRQKYMKFLRDHPNATPDEVKEKAHKIGVDFSVDTIKARQFQKQKAREVSSLETGDTFRVASSYLGIRELADAQSNPQIDKWISMNGRYDNVATDSTAWCSAFVNGVAEEAGFEHTNKLNAQSWLDIGEIIDPRKAVRGDVVVFRWGSQKSFQGHVGFFDGYDANGRMRVLGGNQGNQVKISTYPANRLLGVRRLKALNS